MLGGWEIAGIVVVVLVLFGAKKVPELMGGLGKGIKEFKKASREVQDEIQQAIDTEPPPPAPKSSPNTGAPSSPSSGQAENQPVGYRPESDSQPAGKD